MTGSFEEILQRLAGSAFRRRFRLTANDRRYILNKGAGVIEGQARRMVSARLGAAFPVHDGRQTPMRGHPVFLAQHATACCCPSCLQKWHGIPRGRELNGAELDFICSLLMAWLRNQMGEVRFTEEKNELFPDWKG